MWCDPSRAPICHLTSAMPMAGPEDARAEGRGVDRGAECKVRLVIYVVPSHSNRVMAIAKGLHSQPLTLIPWWYRLLKHMDTDGGGNIDCEEFCTYFEKAQALGRGATRWGGSGLTVHVDELVCHQELYTSQPRLADLDTHTEAGMEPALTLTQSPAQALPPDEELFNATMESFMEVQCSREGRAGLAQKAGQAQHWKQCRHRGRYHALSMVLQVPVPCTMQPTSYSLPCI